VAQTANEHYIAPLCVYVSVLGCGCIIILLLFILKYLSNELVLSSLLNPFFSYIYISIKFNNS